METDLLTKLESIQTSLRFILPELFLTAGILVLIVSGFFIKTKSWATLSWLALVIILLPILFTLSYWSSIENTTLFDGMLSSDRFSTFFKVLIDGAGLLTIIMSMRNHELKDNQYPSEYFALILSALLGAHLLVMSTNFIMIFISLELLSISSYVLAGYSLNKKGAEGSLKYFLFGSVASAVMLYGLSILFGLTATLNFSSTDFIDALANHQTPLFLVAGSMTLAGFLYKLAAAPMHLWAPDVYEAAPMPVLAFLSTAPKLAGLAILAKFTLALNLFGQSAYDWQLIIAVIAMISITVGNFSALWQNHPKRMMAYSSIAQSGFLMIGIVCFSIEGIHFMLFYSIVYVIANYAVFICLQTFEKNNIIEVASFKGVGKSFMLISVVLIIAFVSLAGIPPTGGFTSKLFIFTALWDAYDQTGKSFLLWLLIFGLLNTVVSLFYYLKIPFHSFLKSGQTIPDTQKSRSENLLALLLVLVILFLFIQPGVLMGWLNRINFVL